MELYVKKYSIIFLNLITLHYSNSSRRASAEHPIVWDMETLTANYLLFQHYHVMPTPATT